MAVTTIGELQFVIGAETRSLQAAQREVNKTVQALRQVTGANEQFSNVNKKVEAQVVKQTRAMQSARETVLNLRTQLRNLSRAGADTTASSRQLARAYGELRRQLSSGLVSQTQFNKSVDTFNRTANRTRRALSQVARGGKLGADATGDLSQRMTDLSKSVQVALGPLSGVASRITALTSLANRNTAAIAGLIGAMIGFGAAATKSIRAGLQFESEMAVIENRVRTLGDSLGFTAEQLDVIAKRLGRDTLTNANEARKAIVALSTATSLGGDNFKQALILSQDLAASGFGDLISQARRLAQVLEDPKEGMDRLRRVGVIFNDQQREIIRTLVETGDVATAQRIVLEELTKKVGGNAKAAAQGLAGAWDTLKETLTEASERSVKESGALDNLTEVVNRVTRAVRELIETSDILPKFGKAVNTVATGSAKVVAVLIENFELLAITLATTLGARVLGRLLPSLISLRVGLEGVRKSLLALLAIKGLKLIFGASPIALIATVVGLITGLLVKLDLLGPTMRAVGGVFEQVWLNMKAPIEGVIDKVKEVTGTIKLMVGDLLGGLVSLGGKIGNKVLDFLGLDPDRAKEALAAFSGKVKEGIPKALGALGDKTGVSALLSAEVEGAKLIFEDASAALAAAVEKKGLTIKEIFSGLSGEIDNFAESAGNTLAQLESDINSIQFPEALKEATVALKSAALEEAGVEESTIKLAASAGILDRAFRVSADGVEILNNSLKEINNRKRDAEQLKEIFKIIEKDLPADAGIVQVRKETEQLIANAKRLAKEMPEIFGPKLETAMKAIENRQDQLISKFEKPKRDAEEMVEKLNEQAEALGKSERELFIINQLLKLDKQGMEELGVEAEEIARTFENVRRAAGNVFDQREAIKQFKSSMGEIASLVDRSFDRIGDQITEMFVRGEEAAIDFGNIVRSVVSEIIQFFTQLAIINPIKNLFLSSVPGATLSPTLSTIGLAGAGVGAAAAGGIGTGGLLQGAGLVSGLVSGFQSPGLGLFAANLGSKVGLGAVGQGILGNAFTNIGFGGLGTLAASLLGLGGGLPSTVLGIGGGLAGGALGSSLGALGSIGGPIGAVAGGLLGSVLGGLFGGKPSREIAGVQFELGKGVTATGGKGASPQQSAEIAKQLSIALQQFAAAVGGTAKGAFSIQTFGNADKFKGKSPFSLNFGFQFESAQDLLAAAPLQLLKDGKVAIAGLGKELTRVLKLSLGRGNDLKQVADDIDFARKILGLASTENLSALRELTAQFDAMRERALSLGLSIKEINEAELRALSDLENQILNSLSAIADEARKLLNLDALFNLRDQLSFGSLSPLAPIPRFEAAKSRFNEVAQAALAGDTQAIRDFPGIAREAVDIGRDTFASGPQFAEFFVTAKSTLDQLIGQQESLVGMIEFELDTTIRQTSEQQVAALKEMQTQLSADLQAVRREIAKRR